MIKLFQIIIPLLNWIIKCAGRDVIHNLEVICATSGLSKTLGSAMTTEIEELNKQISDKYVIHNTGCSRISAWDAPQAIHNAICKILQPKRRKKSVTVTSTVLVVSDNLDAKSSKVIEYFVNLISNLGVPTITWLPSQLGQILFEEGPMALRLEPSNKHLAEAMFDFVQTYNWNMVVLLVSLNLSGSMNFVQMLKEVITERESSSKDDYFKLKIVDEIFFDGFIDQSEIMSVLKSEERLSSYKKSLEHILAADHRIILFYGMKYDLIIMHKIALKDPNLSKIFGAEFVWILCPEAITPTMSVMNKKEKFSPSLELSEDMPPLPGVFGFAYAPTTSMLKDNLNIATSFWKTSVENLINNLTIRNNISRTEILERMIPKLNCQSKVDRNDAWTFGKYIYKFMSTLSVDYNSNFYQFSVHNYLNSTSFLVMNTRSILDKSPLYEMEKEKHFVTSWTKVGTWIMSSTLEEKRTKLQIDGVTWPGEVNKPPLGRPSKFKLRVSTLKEEPFVIFSVKQDKTCGNNALACSVLHDSLSISVDDFEKSKNRTKYLYMGNENYTDACCTGMAIDILRELMKDLNFEVDLYEVPDRKWGAWSAEKGWNGLLESLINRKVDMAVSAFKITPNRSEQVDFTVPFQETGIAILVALHEGSISPTAFLKPYDWASWMVILIFSVHCCSTAMFIYEWLSPKGLDRGNVPPREHKFSLFRALWLIWAMLFGASVNVDSPRGMASRFLGCIWALFGLVFLASYTANLAAFMIAKEDHYDLKGLNDWRFQRPWNFKPEFRFATVPFSASEENIALNYPDIALYMRRYNKSSVEEGIRALKQKEIDAFIYDSNVLEFRAAKDEGCKLRTVGNLYAVTGYGIAFPKGSKWYSKVNDLIMQYQKYDLLHRWKTFWLTGACKKTDKLANTNRTLGVRNFISAFILLLTGLIISTLLLICEHLFFRYLRPRMSNLDQYGCCGLISLSMGQLLSFEQTVNQTVDFVKNYKCHNPLCENQIWRLRKELEMSKEIIRKLETSFEGLNSSLRKNPKYDLPPHIRPVTPYNLWRIKAFPKNYSLNKPKSMSSFPKFVNQAEADNKNSASLLKSKEYHSFNNPPVDNSCQIQDADDKNKNSNSSFQLAHEISRRKSSSFISINSIPEKLTYTCFVENSLLSQTQLHSNSRKCRNFIIQQESSL